MAQELLNLSNITEPFNLRTALKYMDENGEFIRCKTDNEDFYMYKDEQRRPAMVNGKRQFVSVTTIWAFNEWGGSITDLKLSDMLEEKYFIMKFKENGDPDWTDPRVKKES